MNAKSIISPRALSAFALSGALLGLAASASAQAVAGVTLEDPAGDDKGPGAYVYPTDKVYKAGAFDLRKFEVIPKGDTVEFRVTVNSRIEDPWDSKAWKGNGFSVQMAFIHIDTDHKPGSGAVESMPGVNVKFRPEEAWDKLVIISPQPQSRLNSEVDSKAPGLKDRVVVPKVTRASGKTLIAIVDAAQLGGAPQASWGYQVLVQSNEGFPDKTDLLTRKVNEYEGQHRFGGGSDYDNDPHVIDMLAGGGAGAADEAKAQFSALDAYNKEAFEGTTLADLATVPMIYPAAGGAAAPVAQPPAASPNPPAAAPRPAAPRKVETFEMNGKIYTKWLYKNDDSRGCLSLSNPFWPDNIGGSNGACTEFEMNIRGRVSRYVTAGVRIKSRFGALWQNWWENGDTRWDYPNDDPFHENTSGETLGMNHAQYMKLRGTFIRAKLPIPTVEWVHIGASDLSMFNAWTVGKVRYIDRDNANGVFFEGAFDDRFRYHTAAIATPKLFVGPRWTSGLQDADPLAGFWGADWTYAFKLEADPTDDLQVEFVASYVNDYEADDNDPDVTGASDADRGTDRAIDWENRFQALNLTLDVSYSPSAWDNKVAINGLLAYAHNEPNHDYATNGVQNDQGFSPVLFLTDEDGNPEAAKDIAGKLLIEFLDPFDNGLNLKIEAFSIGSEFNAIFGARREADVLLTEGIITSGFISGGQLPTLNLANEFVDFDEPWYESIIGWRGLTGLLEWVSGSIRTSVEYTMIDYNTDQQFRDTDNQYPDFLYTDGFTDPQAFTADFDYSNVFDRGSDPRSVYKLHQSRFTQIAIFNGETRLPYFEDTTLSTKLKLVLDTDKRNRTNTEDNYDGQMLLAYGMLRTQWNNELSTGVGYEIQDWEEKNRSGSQETGFFDYHTRKHTGRFVAGYDFGGLKFGYLLEYFHKDQERNRPGVSDQAWRVWRSKATLEVAW
ncbi:MAG: glucodextranase DOMON-like domain-containing protein [Bradymonadia bacterium]